MAALLDSGFIVALLADNDQRHDICVQTLRHEPHVLLPEVTLPEIAHLVLRDMDHQTLARFLRSVGAGKVETVSTTRTDLLRAADLLEQYADNRLDFVDCAIIALAERLGITRILTVDRRHFSIIRPVHTPYFEILP